MAPTKSIQKVRASVADPTPTPIPAGGFQISLVLMIGDIEYVLTGNSFKDGVKVVYSQPWQQAADLGSITEALTTVGTTLGLGDLGTQAMGFLSNLPAPLDKVAAAVMNAHLIITDLIIDTTGTAEGGLDVYSFGFGLKFSANPPVKVGTVQLEAFLIQYTYTKAHSS